LQEEDLMAQICLGRECGLMGGRTIRRLGGLSHRRRTWVIGLTRKWIWQKAIMEGGKLTQLGEGETFETSIGWMGTARKMGRGKPEP